MHQLMHNLTLGKTEVKSQCAVQSVLIKDGIKIQNQQRFFHHIIIKRQN